MNFEKTDEISPTNGAVRADLPHIIFSVVFLFILFIPLIEDIYHASKISTETFIGKDELHSLVNNFKYRVVHDRVFNGLIAEQDGWLVYTDENSLDDFQNTDPLNKVELETIRKRLKSLCSSVNEAGIYLIIVIPPNKNTIYSERLTPQIPRIKDKSRLDQILSVWKNTENCTMIDLRGPLLEAKQHAAVYNATDTHWNYAGAYIAYERVVQVIRKDFPAVVLHPLSDFEQKQVIISGDLGPKFAHIKIEEEDIQFKPKFQPSVIQRAYGPITVGKIPVHDFTVTMTGKPELPVAIVYRDSFFDHLYRFIGESFNEGYYYWSHNIDFPMLRKKKPDYLILEATERYLLSAIYTWTNSIQ